MGAKHILYISYDGMTDPLGQSQVLPYLTGLAQKGFSVSILSCEKKEAYDAGKGTIRQLVKQYGIEWHPIAYHRRPPVVSTLLDLQKLKKKVKSIHLQKPVDLLHCRSYISALIGLHFKQKEGIPFIFDMRGFWADERIDGKIWSLNNPIYRFIYNYFKRKEKEFLLEADAIVSLTENARNEMLSWDVLKNKKNQVDVIPTCADLDFFSPKNIRSSEIESRKKALGINPDDFVLSYIGSLGTWYLLNEMLAFFQRVLLKKAGSKFLFVTHENGDNIRSAAKKIGVPLQNIVVVKGARKEMPVLISLGNASVFFIKPAFSKKASSPTKLGELMGMGIPVVCNSGIGDVDQIVLESQSGVLIKQFDAQEFDKKFEELIQLSVDKSLLDATAKKYFSLETGVNSYQKIYDRITK